MARIIQLNSANHVIGFRQAKVKPEDSETEKFIQYNHSEDNERWSNFWPESRRNGLVWPNGLPRYIYDDTLKAPILQPDTTDYIRINAVEKGTAKGIRSVIRFVWLGTTGSRVEDYQGIHYVTLEKAGEAIPVRLIFDEGLAVLREVLEPGWYDIRRARGIEDATNFPALIGDLRFAVYINAGDPALLEI